MRKIIVTEFLTMDGVMQAPGAPEEDTSGHFKWGGWMAPFDDDKSDEVLGKIFEQDIDLLLGRRTYDIFAAYWPHHTDNPIGEKFNRIQKFVVSTTLSDPSWQHTTVLNTDELKQLKQQEGPDLLVHGSSTLVQTLLEEHLIDVLHIWICPVTLGSGKKIFREGTQAQEWKLTNTVVGSSGIIIATYLPMGEARTGTIGAS